MINSLHGFLDRCMGDVNVQLKYEVDDIVKQYSEEYQSTLNLKIREFILKEIKSTDMQDGSKTCGVYNFTNIVLEEDIENLLKMGPESVPNLKLRSSTIREKINDAFIDYLNRFLKRRVRYEIKAKKVEDWLKIAMTMSFERPIMEFFSRFLQGYKCMRKYAKNDCLRGRGLFYKHRLIQILEEKDSVVILCDKNMGMSVFNLDVMLRADREIMEQMGGERVEFEVRDVIEKVFTEIDIFEQCLDIEEKEYLDVVYSDRSIRKCEINVPFLRCTHKIHKMTQSMIQKKDTTRLKFRPVIDAKKWATRGYAELVMKMLKKFNLSVLERGGEIIKNSQPKGGWEFALDVQNVEVNKKLCVFANADIQEAYTNVTEDMVCKAVEYLNKRFNIYSGWKINLLVKLIQLVMRNNYVETSCGIFLFKPVLPMGYKISGEALNTVVLFGEIERFGCIGESLCFGLGELKDYPGEFLHLCVQNEVQMVRGVKMYKRYVDDTFTLIVGDDSQTVLDGILGIGFMFPMELIITIELNIWRTKFLDVNVWYNVVSGKFSTSMQHKQNKPFGHVKAKSNHPNCYKLQSLMGELLRNRRISSDNEVISIMDDVINRRFVSIGYSSGLVFLKTQELKRKIKAGYTEHYTRREYDCEIEKRFKYGGAIDYSQVYGYSRGAYEFIRRMKLKGEPSLLIRPCTKLKNLIYTKRRYLKRQRNLVSKYKQL